MSVDFLDAKRKEITDRLAELQPVVEEYRRLEAAVAALGISSSPAHRGPGRPRGSRSTGKPGRRSAAMPTAAGKSEVARAGRRGRRKGTGTRAIHTLKLVTENPGIKIPELAERMGIKQNYLYRVLPGLEQEGKVKKEKGGGWHPASQLAKAS